MRRVICWTENCTITAPRPYAVTYLDPDEWEAHCDDIGLDDDGLTRAEREKIKP